ncbi:MAG: SPFH domain-containing protein [Kiritimatiellae bacterium]|nr:SPFH domain-containing protein [Kiritimatiellia bacterium]
MHILDVAKWNATDNETIACKMVKSSHDDRFSTHTRLIVSTGQEAVVVINGKMTGPFRPCAEGHVMNTKNLPILTDIWAKLAYSGETPYPAEVWFVQTLSAPDFGWGTPSPVMVGAKYDSNGICVDLTAGVTLYGTMGFSIVDTMRFMESLVQTKPVFSRADLREVLNAKLMQLLKPSLAKMLKTVSLRDVVLSQDVIGNAIFQDFKTIAAEFGIELSSFTVEDVRLTSETSSVIADLDQKAAAVAKEALERSVLGLSRKEERQFDVADLAAGNEGAGSVASPMMGAAIGMGVAGSIAGSVVNSMPGIGVPSVPPPIPEISYALAINGKQYGPYPLKQIATCVKDGVLAVTPETLVWRSGLSVWVRASECSDLMAALSLNVTPDSPPPLPRM